MIARHSFSTVAYDDCAGDSFLLAYATGKSVPPYVWSNIGPSPESDASVRSMKSHSMSGNLRIGLSQNLDFNSLNAVSVSSVQITWLGCPFFIKLMRGVTTLA